MATADYKQKTNNVTAQLENNGEQWHKVENTPIFKAATEIACSLFHISKYLPKKFPHLFLDRLMNEAYELKEKIYMAYAKEDNYQTKIKLAEDIPKHTARIVFQLQTMYSFHDVERADYSRAIALIRSIETQASAWRNRMIERAAQMEKALAEARAKDLQS